MWRHVLRSTQWDHCPNFFIKKNTKRSGKGAPTLAILCRCFLFCWFFFFVGSYWPSRCESAGRGCRFVRWGISPWPATAKECIPHRGRKSLGPIWRICLPVFMTQWLPPRATFFSSWSSARVPAHGTRPFSDGSRCPTAARSRAVGRFGVPALCVFFFRRRRGRASSRSLPVAQEQRTLAAAAVVPTTFRPVPTVAPRKTPPKKKRKREPHLDVCQRHVL